MGMDYKDILYHKLFDEYIPLVVRIDNFGNVTVKRDSEMDTNGGSEEEEDDV